MTSISVLKQRENQIYQKGNQPFKMECETKSLAGAVSQRACVFCGSRVVLYPIADALHLIHGPIGCASYTWDIRGAQSSGPELHRMSFSTDLSETDIIYGGEKKLKKALLELIEKYSPKAAFIYCTCIVGIIGDDVDAICRQVEDQTGIPVIAVHSEGFKGTKKDGYKAACDALFSLIERNKAPRVTLPDSINILGEFNIGGETWIIKKYYESMGVKVVSVITGDGRVEEVQQARNAALNVVQCSGSVIHLAKQMEKDYGIPYIRVSYFGIEDTSDALYQVAVFFDKNPEILKKTQDMIRKEVQAIVPRLETMKKDLEGKKAAIYVGGAFKAFSMIKALKTLGMEVVLAGSQTGTQEDYEVLRQMCNEGTVILDDSNPLELAKYSVEKDADLFIGGVKERPIAYKMGIGFCDHNHERKIPLVGFEGMVNFAKEVHGTVTSPVWDLVPRRQKPAGKEGAI
ncbi:nitrogenase iron-molybdenum cofactor biosynthesis protein NifE [Desulfobacter hydrogenophilus]|uniref:Nitrogenase iron-molybdenum cofactor biosynthesis protein NifE n=1 Tax=Desulfobacter hydrogenophilus TaxID=2291 RepID=A0A328FA95_9BACT|nr:nitrogenase iron-molybdenum cofactor biosynthesis protein NifE [Desulfobacter hydrogenophilus]NDY74476.1 nitrogenase iron-molybdenum cofactor biosynthesis protein NifE [Desulfobacter hydrogenophilus]QBH12061.1 nitrogenase iron-molybdenum cofactor biosynthesis protein NifE [Desulfobacter hydrogenophilus]QBH14194.1 nitrogenase iron-molybdenum cofactor biosynthesis protein NifE [Desulfobacter hydrogenophilus]RAL99956.1 nitrogenase iron-molybdenum cofactor biosynthesis protein NifE [Desulfobacte